MGVERQRWGCSQEQSSVRELVAGVHSEVQSLAEVKRLAAGKEAGRACLGGRRKVACLEVASPYLEA